MIGDNPAARLLEILEEGKKYNGTENCKVVWRKLLSIDGNNDALLLSRLGKLMGTIDTIKEIIIKDFPNHIESIPYWSNNISYAFSVQNVNSSWDEFNKHISNQALVNLKYVAEIIQLKTPKYVLEKDKINELRQNVDELLTEVLESGLSESVKKQVARNLQKILIALDEYRITGAEPLFDAIESAVGHAIIDEEYTEELAVSNIGKKFGALISKLSGIIMMTEKALLVFEKGQKLIGYIKNISSSCS